VKVFGRLKKLKEYTDLKDLGRYLFKSVPIASLFANLIDIPYSIIKRRCISEENMKYYYFSRVYFSSLRLIPEIPLALGIVYFNDPSYFAYFTIGETIVESIMELYAKL
jgi:hypothetical protein